MTSPAAREGCSRRARRRRAAVLALAVLMTAAPAGAGALDEASVVSAPGDLSLRVPVWAQGGLGGLLRPYVAGGLPVDGDRPADGMPLSLRQPAPGLDESARLSLGAGLGLTLHDRVSLFGEYRFLHVRPDVLRPASGADRLAPGRAEGGGDLRGGLSIGF